MTWIVVDTDYISHTVTNNRGSRAASNDENDSILKCSSDANRSMASQQSNITCWNINCLTQDKLSDEIIAQLQKDIREYCFIE